MDIYNAFAVLAISLFHISNSNQYKGLQNIFERREEKATFILCMAALKMPNNVSESEAWLGGSSSASMRVGMGQVFPLHV